MKNIYVTKPYLPPIDEYIEKLKIIWKNHILTNMGPLHRELEQKLTHFLDVPYCLCLANGHLSLETVLQALDLKGEVITTPFTFASTTHAIVRCGLKPVFCDVKKSNYTIDPLKIENLITANTCAIVPVHVYGQICDVEQIQSIANRYNLKVIYDAAHAFGERRNCVGIGNYGDASIFSFHATKPFNTIEGGAVAFSDSALGVKIYQLKNFGFMGEDLVCGVGGNAKLSEFHAAMGLCNLEHYTEINNRRKQIVMRYRENLASVPGLAILHDQENVEENYAYFPVVFHSSIFGKNRDEVYETLKKNGIYARRYFFPLTKNFPCYHNKYQHYETPIADYISNNVLALPLYDSLKLDEVDSICSLILKR